MKCLSAHRPATRSAAGERGIALVVVLLVLLALLILATPFLSMARNADRSSAQAFDRSEVRLALDVAGRHGRHLLSASHPSIDPTPYFDDEDELTVDNSFPEGFFDANDPNGTMWDVDARDIAGRIDLNSAGPFVLANLIAAASRTTRPVEREDGELPGASAAGFGPAGYLWIAGEHVRYAGHEDGEFLELVRGLYSTPDSQEHGGPRPPSLHDIGQTFVDQRAFAPALWRMAGGDGELRRFGSPEELALSEAFAWAGADGDPTTPGLEPNLLEAWTRNGTIWADVRGGRRWRHAARLTSRVEGGLDGRIELDTPQRVNAGSTVRIESQDAIELALVQRVEGSTVFLDQVLQSSFEPYEAEVRVLVRRPVNVNTATPGVLEALFANLQIVGRNARVTTGEARQLAALVVASRPFEGHEDFLRRVVLPAAGLEELPGDAPVVPESLSARGGFIDAEDAWAVVANALDANDGRLAVSTMPLCYTSSDVFEFDLRATVNAKSGVERASAAREEVALVVPQQELFALWARQEDFDESFRLDGEAPWWATGPAATSPWDGGATPPSRVWPFLGTYAGKPFLPGVTEELLGEDPAAPARAEHVFPSREDDGWAALWPARVADVGELAGRVLHFDHETRDGEGRYLADEVVALPTDDDVVDWTPQGGDALLRPMFGSLWFRPQTLADQVLLDVGGDQFTDRVSLLLEGPDLVLRVLDGPGDHRATALVEAGEMRYAIAPGDGPGLPLDTWSHVAFDVRGNRPDQMTLLVNGMAHGVRALGLTRLSSSIDETSSVIPVESTEGFPAAGEPCVVRIGEEVIECTVSENSLIATRSDTGPEAGFGGRSARIRYSGGEPDAPLETPDGSHEAGTMVELYGYSLPLVQDIQPGRGELVERLGPFRVAWVQSMVDGTQAGGDAIQSGNSIAIGMEGEATSDVTGLVLASAEVFDSDDPFEYMGAFGQQGGYALLVQTYWAGNTGQTVSSQGTPLGGVEVIRHAGWEVPSGSEQPVLTIAARGQAAAAELTGFSQTSSAFVSDWQSLTNGSGGPLIATQARARLYVVPLSIPVDTAGASPFLDPSPGLSEFAQLTHTAAAELTEWVRYDTFERTRGHLVRHDPQALEDVQMEITGSLRVQAWPPLPPPPAPPPPGASGAGFAPSTKNAPAAPAAAQGQPFLWLPEIGFDENEDYALSRAVGSALQLRGVLGTYSHDQPAGTPVLPVFHFANTFSDGGRPGRFDRVFALAGQATHIGWPMTVHRAHRPGDQYERAHWRNQPGNPGPTSAPSTNQLYSGFLTEGWRAAFDERCPDVIPAGSVSSPGTGAAPVDARLVGRISKFPSGERPRAVTRMALGSDVAGGSPAAPTTVDEVVFGDPIFPRSDPDGELAAGAQLVLSIDASDSADVLTVVPDVVRIAGGRKPSANALSDLPEDAGLLRIGGEILAYDSRDASTGTLTVARGGRGLLGTRPQSHAAGEPLTFLEHWIVSELVSDVAGEQGLLPLEDLDDFPRSGTVLVGDELVHYTGHFEGGLWMPRRSSVPGAMDGRGEALFRGRFGTDVVGHVVGEPVILFPFRYWDRWAEQADAPELAYLGLSIDQPAAFVRSVFFAAEEPGGGAARIAVLQRTDPDTPWDAAPDEVDGLELLEEGTHEGRPLAVGRQSDRPEWRVHVRYAPGAFEPRTGLSHGWKETPRLTRFGAFYLAPSITLRSVER